MSQWNASLISRNAIHCIYLQKKLAKCKPKSLLKLSKIHIMLRGKAFISFHPCKWAYRYNHSKYMNTILSISFDHINYKWIQFLCVKINKGKLFIIEDRHTALCYSMPLFLLFLFSLHWCARLKIEILWSGGFALLAYHITFKPKTFGSGKSLKLKALEHNMISFFLSSCVWWYFWNSISFCCRLNSTKLFTENSKFIYQIQTLTHTDIFHKAQNREHCKYFWSKIKRFINGSSVWTFKGLENSLLNGKLHNKLKGALNLCKIVIT